MAQLSAVLNSPNLSRPVPDPSRPVVAPPRRQQRQITVNFSSTITRATEQEANMRALRNVPFNPPPEVEESKPLWDWFSSHGSFYLLTNFNEEYLEVLYEEMLPYIAEARRRGTRPKVGWKDALLLYLTWAKTASTYDALAANISITKSCLEDTLKRVRPVLFKTLQARWWNNRLRPKPLPSGDDAFFALLIDSISVEVFRPAGRFDEVKCYWDGKNEMYALKKEVAVTASAPHIALFTSKAEVGSTHDFKLHKNCFEQYLPYLAKRDQERTLIPTDTDNQNWAVLGDSAYSGPATETLQERRVALKKPSSLQTVAERIRNTQLARIRVPVEQFFGRLTQLWGIIRGIYRWDHIHFDEDFDICVLLTNENTNQNLLTEEDYLFLKVQIQERVAARERKKLKRKAQNEEYLRKKRDTNNH